MVDDFTPIGRVIYSDDADRVISDIEYSAEHLTYFTCEFRVQIPGKEIQWIFSRSSPEKLPDGSVTWYGFNADITARKIAEDVVKENNSRLELAMHSANMAWWEMDITTGKVIFDRRKSDMLGYPAEKFSHYKDFVALVHPQDVDKSMKAMQKHIDGLADKYEVEYRILAHSGEYKWFYDIGAIVNKDTIGKPLKVTGLVIDITERKLHEEHLFESEIRFSKLYENSPFGMMMVNHEFRFINVNPMFCKIIGYSEAELLQLTFKDISHPDDLVNDLPNIRKLINKEIAVYKTEKRYIQKDGKVIWGALIVTANYDKEGRFLYNLAILEDITPRKLAEENIRQLNDKLEQRVIERTAQLEAANKELEAFSYSVSHDLRAPLRHINGYVNLLNERFMDNLPEMARHYLITISDAANQMGTLIDDLLQFSRSGRQEIHKAKFDMDVLVHELLGKIKPNIKKRKINWLVQKMPEVYGDSALLKQVWVNLLDNAVKYTMYKESAEISIGYREDEINFVFFIKDNGVGFDMKYAQKLFGVFQRLHSQSEFEGTGIGLANVQRIVHKHNGKVWAEAEPNKGSTFFFCIPKIK